MMRAATLRIRFANVTLNQLCAELEKLRFAGWADSEVEFTSTIPNTCEVKLFREFNPDTAPRKAPTK